MLDIVKLSETIGAILDKHKVSLKEGLQTINDIVVLLFIPEDVNENAVKEWAFKMNEICSNYTKLRDEIEKVIEKEGISLTQIQYDRLLQISIDICKEIEQFYKPIVKKEEEKKEFEELTLDLLKEYLDVAFRKVGLELSDVSDEYCRKRIFTIFASFIDMLSKAEVESRALDKFVIQICNDVQNFKFYFPIREVEELVKDLNLPRLGILLILTCDGKLFPFYLTVVNKKIKLYYIPDVVIKRYISL